MFPLSSARLIMFTPRHCAINGFFILQTVKVAEAPKKMTMGEENMLSSLTMPILVGPSINNLEKRDPNAAQILKAAFTKAESTHPGLCHNFVMGLTKRTDVKINMNESLLRMQGAVSELDSNEFRIKRPEDSFQVTD